MNVLSLFDGMSCGIVALGRANIQVDNYYSSEIDKYAIQISNKNYPDIIRLGSVSNWKEWNLPQIDLLIGGSPCQGFSIVGKGLNFDDPRSKLFFEYVNILKILKPKYFLLENVKMKKEWQDIISEYLGVQPIKINSALVSAQNRERLYWTNIPNIQQPEDKDIYLKDIIEENVNDEFYSVINEEDITKGNMEYIGAIKTDNHKKRLDDGKTLSRNFSQGYRIYGENGKAQTLVSTGIGGLGGATGLYQIKGAALRNQITKRGTESQLNIRKDEKSNCVVSSYPHKLNGIVRTDNITNTHYRKLSPIECERLQTLPDNYTEGVSNSQRYKMLGNGWTADVIAHIFKNIKHD